jgi:type IV pilus assembly protein PilM
MSGVELRHRGFRWLSSPAPTSALVIGSARVVGVTLGRAGDGPAVARHAVETLPPGLVTPGLNQANVSDPAALAGAVGRVLDQIGRPRRIGLVLPDAAAKVSLVRFETLPSRSSDLDQLVRWQVRRAVPFPIDGAQVSWSPGARLEHGRELVVTVMRRDVVQEYEAACVGHRTHPGLVDIATFNLVNLVIAADRRSRGGDLESDWLLVSLTPDYSALAIVRGTELIFYRYRPSGAEEPLADLVHQASMYYEDRLGGRELSRVVIGGGEAADSAQVDALRDAVSSRWQCRVESLDAGRAVPVAERGSVALDLWTAMAPAVGLVLREA